MHSRNSAHGNNCRPPAACPHCRLTRILRSRPGLFLHAPCFPVRFHAQRRGGGRDRKTPASFPVLMGPARRPAQVKDLQALPDRFPKGPERVLLIPTPCPCLGRPSALPTLPLPHPSRCKGKNGAPGGPNSLSPPPKAHCQGSPTPRQPAVSWSGAGGRKWLASTLPRRGWDPYLHLLPCCKNLGNSSNSDLNLEPFG